MMQCFFQVDANTSFLRAARAGDLGKLVDFLESGEVTDINASNAVIFHTEPSFKYLISYCGFRMV